MMPSNGPIQPHHAGAPSRVIQGFFPGGKPRIIQAATAPAPVRPPAAAPIQARPASLPAPILPGALQPALRPGQPPRPILPTNSLQTRTLHPAAPVRPQSPQPILPKSAAPSTVQPHAGESFALPVNFALKPKGSGQPLPEPIQKKMESFFNTSFADVRVHVGHEAPSIGALAFTHGTDLYFAPGKYNPQTVQGQQLLGHELTHVVQQRAGRVRNPLGSGIAVVQDAGLEAEAERMGMQAASASVPIQAMPAGIGPVVAPFAATVFRPVTVAANGAILPSRLTAHGALQRRLGPILPGKSSASGKTVPDFFFSPYNHRSAVVGTRGDGSTIQLYRIVPGTGRQGGDFVYGNAQIHLHINIGIKSHLKIEGQKIKIAKKGGLLDPQKIQDALVTLLDFRTGIAGDKPRAEQYAQPIQDCIDWLTEKGAVIPQATTTIEEPKRKQEVEVPQNTGYGDFFANATKGSPVNEDDFM